MASSTVTPLDGNKASQQLHFSATREKELINNISIAEYTVRIKSFGDIKSGFNLILGFNQLGACQYH